MLYCLNARTIKNGFVRYFLWWGCLSRCGHRISNGKPQNYTRQRALIVELFSETTVGLTSEDSPYVKWISFIFVVEMYSVYLFSLSRD